MKTPNYQQFGEPSLTFESLQYEPVVPEDKGPLKRKHSRQQTKGTANNSRANGRASKQKVPALTELILQLPVGGSRELLSEAFTAIINGEGDIKLLRALTMRAARQLRTMYLSGGEKALTADTRWEVREFIWNSFGIQVSIGPKGLLLAEGQGAEDFNAFIQIEANGHVWSGETYEDAPEGPLTEPLTTEDVLQRLSEKLLQSLY